MLQQKIGTNNPVVQRCNPWFRLLFSSNPSYHVTNLSPGYPRPASRGGLGTSAVSVSPTPHFLASRCFMVVIGEALMNLTTLPKMKHEHDVKSQTSNYHYPIQACSFFSVLETTTWLSGRLDIRMYSIHITHSNSPRLKHEVWRPKVVLWIHTQPCGHWR